MMRCAVFEELDEILSRSIELDIDKEKHSVQHLFTADLFGRMAVDEVISHFMPIRGIDYDQNYIDDDSSTVKKEKKDDTTVYMADEFLPYHKIPQIKPVYQLNAELFKSIIPSNRVKETNEVPIGDVMKCDVELPEKDNLLDDCEDIPVEKQVESSSCPLVVTCEENNDIYLLDIEETNESPTATVDGNPNEEDEKNNAYRKTEPRPIMKRKPRTYKYNPKPLQRKVNRAFVPDDLKDVEYWERRKRNNEAAKKSRKERRQKELEIINNYEEIRQELQTLKSENSRLKARNVVLEKQLIKEMKSKK